MKYIFTILFSILLFLSYSQTNETFNIEDSGITPVSYNANDGKVTITQDDKLRKAIKRHIEINNDKFDGYRVQIYFKSGQHAMGEAENVRKSFLTRYGNQYGAYRIFDSPNFKVQVGDFRTRAEAMHFMGKIKKTYPNSWIVRLNVNYPVDLTD